MKRAVDYTSFATGVVKELCFVVFFFFHAQLPVGKKEMCVTRDRSRDCELLVLVKGASAFIQ